MSSRTAQEAIRGFALYKSGDHLTAGVIRSHLESGGIIVSKHRASEILRDMAQNGELVPSMNGWRRASNARAWITKTWRSCGNDFLEVGA